MVKRFFSGTPEGIRTPDPLVRSQILYPAELLAHLEIQNEMCYNIYCKFIRFKITNILYTPICDLSIANCKFF